MELFKRIERKLDYILEAMTGFREEMRSLREEQALTLGELAELRKALEGEAQQERDITAGLAELLTYDGRGREK